MRKETRAQCFYMSSFIGHGKKLFLLHLTNKVFHSHVRSNNHCTMYERMHEWLLEKGNKWTSSRFAEIFVHQCLVCIRRQMKGAGGYFADFGFQSILISLKRAENTICKLFNIMSWSHTYTCTHRDKHHQKLVFHWNAKLSNGKILVGRFQTV